MIDCVWNEDGPPWKCQQCGWPYERQGEPILSDKPPNRNCPKAPDLRPAAEKLGISWDDVEHYAQALARWTVAGFPVRTQKEVAKCFRICKGDCDGPSDSIRVCKKPCEHYHKGKTLHSGRCGKCRCRVNKSRVAVLNLIKMATENCPEEKW